MDRCNMDCMQCAVCHVQCAVQCAVCVQCACSVQCALCRAACSVQCVISFTASELNCDGMRAVRNNSFHIHSCAANVCFLLKKWSRELSGVDHNI